MAGEFASAEGGELQPLDPGQPDQLGQQRPQRVTAVQRIGPVAGHQRHPTRPQGAGQEGDQVAAGTVGPVQILQHHHHRGSLRPTHQQSAHGVKHLHLVQAVAVERTPWAGLVDPR